jgi:hypothetical protein
MTSTMPKRSEPSAFNLNEALAQTQCEGETPCFSSSPDYHQLRPQSLTKGQQVFERLGTSLVFLCFALLVLAFGVVIALKDHQDVQESTWRTIQDVTVKVSYAYLFSLSSLT